MIYVVMLFTLLVSGEVCAAARTVLDEILAVLPHPTGDIVILSSDLQMSFDGAIRSFYEVVLDGLMVLRARDMGIIPSATVIDAMIISIQKRYGLTHDQLVELFEAQGFSFEEGRELLKRRKMIDELVGYMVRVDEPSKEEIERYHAAHIETEEATYTIRLGFIQNDSMKRLKKSDLLEPSAAGHVSWDVDIEYLESDLSGKQHFVCDLKVGDIYIMGQSDDGYDVVQLVAMTPKRIIPIDEAQISLKLRQEKFNQELKVFNKSLIEGAKIRFCGNEDLKKELAAE